MQPFSNIYFISVYANNYLVPRAILKNSPGLGPGPGIILLEIFTWFDSSILKQSKLIYAMLSIFHDGWFER